MATVIDNGSGVIKVGVADEEAPDKMFSNIVGRPDGNSDSGILVGDQVTESKERLKTSYPMEYGIVQNWDDMERIWKYALGGKTEPVLLTESTLSPQSNKVKGAEIFFEKFQVKGFYVEMQDILSLYSSGRTTGIMLNCGDGITSAVPIYEGYALRHAIQRSNIGGRDVTRYLQMLLRKGGYNFRSSMELEVVKKIKEKRCYLSLDLEKDEEEYTEFDPATYKLPDNKVINIGPEKFRAPELLLNPSLIGKECDGLGDCVEKAILDSDLDIRKILCTHITCSGGSTKIKNFGERMLGDLQSVFPPQTNIKIFAPHARMTAAWCGGAILAGMSTFQDRWVTPQEYKESGKRAILQKCR